MGWAWLPGVWQWPWHWEKGEEKFASPFFPFLPSESGAPQK